MEIAEGVLFAILWASATAATKFGIRSVEPLLLACIRFLLVGGLLTGFVYVIRAGKFRLPTKKEFKHLFILGLLNITLYIAAFVIAVKMVSAGLVSLFNAMPPLVIILLSAIWLKRPVLRKEWLGIGLAMAGLAVAAIPNLQNSHATIGGIVILLLGQVALATGSTYYAGIKLELPRLVINAWQTAIGGLLLIPLAFLNRHNIYLVADSNFYWSLGWLVIPVSVIAYGLWLHLLHKDAVKAGMWLFVTPVLGYVLAVWLLREKVTVYAIVGALMVIAGVSIAKRKKT
ncbi:drug/metabolite transporter (DMT)-like permease [Filimonas zeae]|uniref:EamA domain-containing protein n=1 Tax=Filimonas zeae TaxID=1737353 RepID=A0A917N0A1_9BACT|nr:EamA family transporter [Filimonas zeae]MDR6342015.1 drug/metabolite transporter (DMT)-like permease [Filimonas zeae]GGH79448.1 hypothetical protein GCM10011379_48830 [Filimonas zeae]